MKQNGNDKVKGSYYLGLDVGTNSVGWAVTDRDYNLLKCKGNAMWGARLFDEAQDASARRTSRTNRRRLARRNQRLLLLELLFAEEIAKVDPSFLLRMEESALWVDDKTNKTCRFSLFHDPAFTDKDYHRLYPTVYHLRNELMTSAEPHDIRLVYLALHHIMKSRGHFLYETASQDDSIRPVSEAFADLEELLRTDYGTALEPADTDAFLDALRRSDIGVNAKQKLLKAARGGEEDKEAAVSTAAVIDLLAGKSGIKLASLFNDESLAEAEPGKISLTGDLEENFDALSTILGDRVGLILQLKDVYDTALLARMLQGNASLSAAKIALYNKNHDDLRFLKAYVRKHAPDRYKEIFSLKREKLNNYAAYSGYKSRSGDHSCTQEEFCKFLSTCKLPKPDESDKTMCRIFAEIDQKVFLTKLKGAENGVVPYQLQRMELRTILKNASGYLPFLNEKDADGLTVREKIEKTFEFRIPYYVGPLNKNAGSQWAVRFAGKENEKIYPWNFADVIDTEASAKAFMVNLVGRCTYTGERVLPKDSLLYSEFMLLNELNPLTVCGKPVDVAVKQAIVRDLFEKEKGAVTKKKIRNYLVSNGHVGKDVTADDIGGVDDRIKTTLRSYHDFREILERTGDREMVEDIILHILVFGSDRAMLKKWLKKHTRGLKEAEIDRICRLRYSDWGRFSKCFLTDILSADPDDGTGEAHSILEMLRLTNCNLMQLLSDRYSFAAQAEEHRKDVVGGRQSLSERLEDLYIAPAVRRSIRQALRIVDEIVDIEKAVPEKIFIEMARDSSKEMKGKRTESRKDKLLKLYDSCREQAAELLPALEKEDEGRLRSDRLYLYYTQFGKCMYSGEPIDLDALMSGQGFDIDHIFPQSRIKDNSLDNRVVVKNTLNRDKMNVYPIDADIRKKMKPYWEMLKSNGMISAKKYDRLVRSTPLTDEELSSFVARQITETQQSTKALSILLQERYGDATRIVFSKAGNVSDFRHDFDMIKCREVNDLHHAKDAYLNIVVGNVYDTRFTVRFFANIRSENYSLNRVFDYDVPRAWKKEETIKTVRKVMGKNNPIVTRMPREVKGQLFDLQLMPAGKGQMEKKTGMDIARYGGYNKITGSFYFVVEHSVKGKRIRSIEPVYLYAAGLYRADPVQYAVSVLGLSEPRIICPEIRADALLELDGNRMYISGRTGDKYVCEHAYQLAIDTKREKYIKALGKYAERCAARRCELPITAYDGITAEENLDLYAFFLEKMSSGVYGRLLKNMKKDLEASKDVFLSKTPYEQVLILLEILKPFCSNAQNANLNELCGKGTVGRITINKKISSLKTASLIHQSVTGLYEVCEDLLG